MVPRGVRAATPRSRSMSPTPHACVHGFLIVGGFWFRIWSYFSRFSGFASRVVDAVLLRVSGFRFRVVEGFWIRISASGFGLGDSNLGVRGFG